MCYKNYSANLTEFTYLKENEITPDDFVEVIADEHTE